MSRKIQGRWAAAAALAITLMAATPAQAVSLGGWGDPSGLFLRAWRWVAVVGRGEGMPGGMVARPGRIVKGGMEIDPNGLTKAGPGSDPNGSSYGAGTSPAASQAPDSGMGADPNGG